jgi:hypothetical protein
VQGWIGAITKWQPDQLVGLHQRFEM